MRLAMVGTGYVGLVSGTCFAEFGINVVCVDKDAGKIERLERGEIPIFEPGLEALVQKQVEAGRLSFTTDLPEAVKGADAVFIAVGTPPRVEDGHADLTYVHEAAKAAPHSPAAGIGRQHARLDLGVLLCVDRLTNVLPVATHRDGVRPREEERGDAHSANHEGLEDEPGLDRPQPRGREREAARNREEREVQHRH